MHIEQGGNFLHRFALLYQGLRVFNVLLPTVWFKDAADGLIGIAPGYPPGTPSPKASQGRPNAVAAQGWGYCKRRPCRVAAHPPRPGVLAGSAAISPHQPCASRTSRRRSFVQPGEDTNHLPWHCRNVKNTLSPPCSGAGQGIWRDSSESESKHAIYSYSPNPPEDWTGNDQPDGLFNVPIGKGTALISPRPNPNLRDRLRGLSSGRFGKETGLCGYLPITGQYG